MKIALVTEYFPGSERREISGGVEARVFYVGKHLAERNDVTVYASLQPGLPRESEFEGMKVVRVRPEVEYSQSSSLAKRITFIRNTVKEMRKESYDVADGYSFVSYPAAWNSRAGKKIATYHDVWTGEWMIHFGLKGIMGEALERYALTRRWDKFIAVSEYTKGKLVKAGVNPEKISVVHNGVDYEQVKETRVAKAETPTVCAVSRLVKYKRIGDLIEAMPEVRKKIPDARLVIIGGGPEEQRLKELARKLGLGESVEFMGFIKDHKKVLDTIKSSHAFCLPSAVEGFGISIIEAMALNVPYVASDIPAIREATHGGAGGLLHKTGDAKDLSEKLVNVLEGNVKADADFIEKEYDWKNLAQKVEEIYRSIN
ncbi:MAG: glycosyltransferase family 4 protein [Candidatus Altiarchaeota archaeon]|nr:glycosyltransferase family 4 protein [Candidatus Altiarchaeota archaeon]